MIQATHLKSNHPGTLALYTLLEGNVRFAAGQPRQHVYTPEMLRELAQAQHPRAVVLTCADSRVAPEVLFDQELGDLFVIRTAGHTVDNIVLGGIEFGITDWQCPLLMVLGHQFCAAVQMSLQRTGCPPSSHLYAVLSAITPAVSSTANEDERLAAAITGHARATLRLLLDRSPIISTAVREDRLLPVAAFYSMETGKVEVLMPE